MDIKAQKKTGDKGNQLEEEDETEEEEEEEDKAVEG